MLLRKTAADAFVSFCFLALVAGCGSVGYQAGRSSSPRPRLVPCSEKLYVRNVEISQSGCMGGIYQSELREVQSAVTAQRLSRALAAQHPDCFTVQEGVPLDLAIEVGYNNYYGSRMGTAMLCGFSFGVLPFWMTSEYRFSVHTDNGKGPLCKALGHKMAETTVSRRGWASIIPTGYIPCPQGSDLPRDYITGPLAVETEISEAAKDLITRQVSDEVVSLVSRLNADDLHRAIILQSALGE